MSFPARPSFRDRECRSASPPGYNVQIWPFVQNLNQLRDIYGETRWEDFISGCGVVQWFTPNDYFTAEYLSRRIGEYTQFIVVNTSTSENHRRQQQCGA